MEKLFMCRVCLAENVRMYIVVNKNLRELYEKLTDNPFVTEDSRPMLACYFCCAKLKRCYQFQRKCLEAEELFAQMNEGYEPNSLLSQDYPEFCNGFILSPIELVSIDEHQTENIAIKEELPADFERLDDIIEPKEEHLSDVSEMSEDITQRNARNCKKYYSRKKSANQRVVKKKTNSEKCRQYRQRKKMLAQQLESKNEVIHTPSTSSLPMTFDPQLITTELVLENPENSYLEVEDIPAQHSESSSEDKPLMEFKIEVEEHEVSGKKQRASDTQPAPVAKKPKLHSERTKLEHVIKKEEKEYEQSDTTVIQHPQNCMFTTCSKFKEPLPYTAPRVTNSSLDINISNNEGSNCKILCVQEKPFKCDKCPRSFNVKSILKRHIRTHTSEKPYKCDICQNSFSSNWYLTNHIRTHTGEKPYKCDVCQHCFTDKASLKKHIGMHTGDKPYKCDICQHCFSVKSRLKKHIETHTNEKPYKCDICHHRFRNKDYLTRHNLAHTGDRPYKCDVCQSSFNFKGELTTHIRTHTGEKPYKCDICHHSFGNKGNLTKHNRVHTGKKPFKCDVCQHCFSSKSHLTNHIHTHTGEKPYKCGICHRRFIKKDNLRTHNRRVHTVEKPYKCDVCQRSYNIKSDLTRHIHTHTGKKLNKCDILQPS